MEYSIKALSDLAGVSTRTLRYYDQIGLLKPARYTDTGYRKYSFQEVERLQLILFYRQVGMPLEDIKKMMDDESFLPLEALKAHRDTLMKKREHIDVMLQTIEATIVEKEGGIIMKDEKRFEGLKEERIRKNDKMYGQEIREKYGEEVINASYAKFKNLDEATYEKGDLLAQKIKEQLIKVVKDGDHLSEDAIKLCEMHQEWIKIYWTTYSKEAHLGLVRMYGQDERFKEYYEAIIEGGTDMLIRAMENYLK